ncbi:hypothetical protein CK203_026670 [Vitis vinifera]|uniref:Uncharacterized protein n=1 Tax=Vitis vinifera TaxID=29760 RepID=A0A438ITW6_VITVI|nr:hypothetical protein CK203_026670 [Vitis vinifera]
MVRGMEDPCLKDEEHWCCFGAQTYGVTKVVVRQLVKSGGGGASPKGRSFVVVDEEMRERHHLQWTRNLVESNRRKERCKDPKVRNAGECNSHVGGRVGKEEEKQVGEVLMVSLEESSLPAYATMMSTLVPKDKEACGSCFQKPYPSTDLALLVKASLCVTSQLSSSSFAKGFLLGQPRTIREAPKGLPLGGGELQRRPHLVNWSIVCLDKKDVIIGKYEKKEGGWCSRASREGYVVGLWKAIQSWWKGFNNRVGFRVGNGRRVWEEPLVVVDGNRLGKLVARIQGSQDR